MSIGNERDEYLLRTRKTYKTMPKGWKEDKSLGRPPKGWIFIFNGKSRLNPEYKQGKVRTMNKISTKKAQNLTTCSGMGATLKSGTTHAIRSTGGKSLAKKCRWKEDSLFAKKASKPGLKKDGTLKKGYRYEKGGKIVKTNKK